MVIEELKNILELSWSKEICFPDLSEEWNEDNKTLGQSAITALIVNDFIGGKIMRCMTNTGSHYYNMKDYKIIDLTIEQFGGLVPDYELGEERTREYLLSSEDNKKRYLTLLTNVRDNFNKYGKKDYKLVDSNSKIITSKVPGTLGGYKKSKIYGKLDCYSALNAIKKGYYVNNRVFFENEETAIEAGYRPCAKCMRKEYMLWKSKGLDK